MAPAGLHCQQERRIWGPLWRVALAVVALRLRVGRSRLLNRSLQARLVRADRAPHGHVQVELRHLRAADLEVEDRNPQANVERRPATLARPGWVGPSRAQVSGPGLHRFSPLGIEVEKQVFRTAWLITGQKFP